MFYWPGGYFGWGGMIISMLFWLLFVGGLIYFVFWLVRRGAGGPVNYRAESAMDILKKRYASGEITREQFLSIKEELKEGNKEKQENDL
ncbi:SHOCT domain-containing protein [Desulfallas sp. Bu1-1]|jgi:putative membrane protein|uniref:SHOCT domain-containing protein n=1 Tax=Desulfallas sp. Bu1-1 TaxID=2787620 RepID=UPI001FAB40AE|nr:SHOCT domain-containing protein [Desulfallas sp. Bu1-1]